jgi:Na+/H+-translocating membrane pyrophosphatase
VSATLEASTSEPESVVSWRTVIGLIGWLTVLTGVFVLIVGCSSVHQRSCTTNLTLSSALTTIVGALLLGTAWLTGEKGDKTPIRASVKMLATYLLILPGLAVVIVIVLFLVFLGLPPG